MSDIVIDMWWCGDPECNCSQPQIHEVTRDAGGFHTWTELWAGSFRSMPDETERTEQELELSNARLLFTHSGGF